MNLDHDVERRHGVTFVTARVSNPAPVKRYVRLENRLDGTVCPPRRNGVPERGWDETGVTLTVPPDSTRGVGYACRAPPDEPPIEIETTGRGTAPDDPPELRARRSLGTFRPPRAVVDGTEPIDDAPVDTTDGSDAKRNGLDDGGNDDPDDGGNDDPDDGDDAARRVELACRLADGGVPEAADVLETLGESDLVDGDGIVGARTLSEGLGDDASELDRKAERLRERAKRLRRAAERVESDAERARNRAERARTVEVPIEALGCFA